MTILWTDMTGAWQPAILFMLAAHLVVGGVLMINRSVNKAANLMLGLLLFTLAGILLRQVFLLSGLFEISAAWAFLPIANDLALAPLILGYIYLLTGTRLPLARPILFAPPVVYILYMTPVLIMPKDVRQDWLNGAHTSIAIPVMTAFSLPAAILATWICWRRATRYRVWLSETSSAKADFEVRGLDLALILIAAPIAGWVLTSATTLVSGQSAPTTEYPFYLLLALCGYVLAMVGFFQPAIEFPKMPEANRTAEVDARTLSDSVVLQAQHEALARSVKEKILNGAWHTEPRLALADVARRCGLTETAISQALNQGLEKNFNRFINEIRVEAVKGELEQGKSDILGLALDTGFNSKATFNRVFKDITGITPSAYRAQFVACKPDGKIKKQTPS